MLVLKEIKNNNNSKQFKIFGKIKFKINQKRKKKFKISYRVRKNSN